MSRDEVVEREPLGSPVLCSIQSLCESFAEASAAIARNDIDDLEKHIESQESACAALLSLGREFPALLNDPRTRQELAKALENLARENRSYSRLLATSGVCNKVMIALCSSYKDFASNISDRDESSRSLSCEV